MAKLKAILFDLDGTLVDSETVHFHCWNELLSPFNIRLDHGQYLREFAGVSLLENAHRVIELYKIGKSAHELAALRKEIYISRLASSEIDLMPHAGQTVRFFHDLNIMLGLVTSSSRTEVSAVLEKSELKKYFSSITTRDDVVCNKPHPEPYQRAMDQLGVTTGECIAVEDTITGATAAKAAGITCFAVQGYKAEAEKLKGIADQIFSTLDEAKKHIVDTRQFSVRTR